MLRSSEAEPAELVAVVDLGSTAVRLLVARVTPDTGYRVLAEARVPTRLGGAAPGEIVVGLGGTVRTLAGIHLRAHTDRTRRHGLRLNQSDVTAVRERLESLSRRK